MVESFDDTQQPLAFFPIYGWVNFFFSQPLKTIRTDSKLSEFQDDAKVLVRE